MSLGAASMFVTLLGLYVAAGLIVALVYAFGGLGRIDPGAKGMPLRARLIVMPGIAGLWPLMLAKLLTQKEPPVS